MSTIFKDSFVQFIESITTEEERKLIAEHGVDNYGFLHRNSDRYAVYVAHESEILDILESEEYVNLETVQLPLSYVACKRMAVATEIVCRQLDGVSCG